MKVSLSLANLKRLDFGKVDVAFQRHISRAIEDCMDRPGDPHPREVLLRLKVEPADNQAGLCDAVMMHAEVASRVPVHRSADFHCRPRKTDKGALLVFDDESPDNADQGTFGDLVEGESNV